jgi:dolichyl-phosphate-mannose-protein mannosyltransferase
MTPPSNSARFTPGELPQEDPSRGSNDTSGRADLLRNNSLPLLVLAAGFVARLIPAWRYFLNPDEALHYLLASHGSLAVTYRAALTNAHPPLLILVLHYWRLLGQSELMLRLPSVLAGTACCWIAYLWFKRVMDGSAALVGLALLAFSPALIELSYEIRQYALLLFFMAACLYLSELSVERNSIAAMVAFSFSLYGALLSHYSSLLFAFTMGVYLLLRLRPYRERAALSSVWVVGQLGAMGLIGYFLVTHVARLRQSGMPQGIAETWLRRSIFHPGENHVVSFVAVQTLRFLTYLFRHGVVGTLALLAFLSGMVMLVRKKVRMGRAGPTSRELALLLGLPFLTNCAVGLAGLYPYGGTRHDAVLALFAVGGISAGMAAWATSRWIKPLVLIVALGLCNVFPAPPPQIRARNHSKALMLRAVETLRRSAPVGSVLFADYQSGLLLGYYVCGHGVVQEFPPLQAFEKTDCGAYMVITARPQEWKFYAEDLPAQLAGAAAKYKLAPGTKIWLFDAGWITDSAPAMKRALPGLGCLEPRSFGENILVCELTLGGNSSGR